MLAFVRGEADVLVATSIIESGLDIPQANTLVVERADQLGLSPALPDPRAGRPLGRDRPRLPALSGRRVAQPRGRLAPAGARRLHRARQRPAHRDARPRDPRRRQPARRRAERPRRRDRLRALPRDAQRRRDAGAGPWSRPSRRRGWTSPSRRTSRASTCRSRPPRSTCTGASRWPRPSRTSGRPARRDRGPLRPRPAAGRGAAVGAAGAGEAARGGRDPDRRPLGPGDRWARSASPAPALRALREHAPRATYSGSERLVSLPAPSLPSERLEAAEAALDALAGAAAVAA